MPAMTEDLEAVYDLEISPLMAQIIQICKRVGMPVLASFQYAPEDFCTTAVLPQGSDESLLAALRCIVPLSVRFHVQERNAAGKVVSDTVILP